MRCRASDCPFAGGGLRFCNIVEALRDSGGAFLFFAVLLFGLLFCQCCPTGEKFQLGFSFICAAVCSPEFCLLSENDEKL